MSSPARSSSAVAPQVAGEGTESTAAPSKPDETEAGSVTPCADTAEAAAVEKLQSKVSHANDGSFLEKFKRMKAEKEKKRKEKEAAEAAEKAAEDQRMKAKRKQESQARRADKKAKSKEKDQPSAAWQAYLDEVKGYEAQTCKEYTGVPIVK